MVRSSPTRVAASSTSADVAKGGRRLLHEGRWDIRGASAPAWSPDGQFIAFIVENADFVYGSVGNFANFAPTRLAVVSLADSAETTLVDDGAMNLSPQWLPDGRGLLFVSNRAGGRDIYRLPLTRAGAPADPAERVTTGLGAQTISLDRAGTMLVYSRLELRSNVYTTPIPRTLTVLTSLTPVTSGTQVIEGFDLSPDGKWLALDSDREGNQDIYRLSLETGELVRLTSDSRDDFLPTWSPDGRWLSFHSIRQGTRDVFIIPSAGGATQQLTNDPGQDRSPRWSPDGSEIVFESTREDDRREIYVMQRDSLGHWGHIRRRHAQRRALARLVARWHRHRLHQFTGDLERAVERRRRAEAGDGNRGAARALVGRRAGDLLRVKRERLDGGLLEHPGARRAGAAAGAVRPRWIRGTARLLPGARRPLLLHRHGAPERHLVAQPRTCAERYSPIAS